MGDLLDLEHTVLDNGLDQKGTVVGLLNGDGNTGREAGLRLLDVLLGGGLGILAAGLVLEVHLIGQGGVVKVLLFADVLDIGDGEADADSKQSYALVFIIGIERKEKAEWGCIIVLLGAELLGEDNLLVAGNILHLPLAVLNSILDGFQLLLKFRDLGRILVSQLILELGEKLDVNCKKKNPKSAQGHIQSPPPDKIGFRRTLSNISQCILPSDEGALKMLEVEKAA